MPVDRLRDIVAGGVESGSAPVIDVDSLYGRRAENRWDRISLGDVFERWAIHSPTSVALVGEVGACSHADYERVSYARADQIAAQFANALVEGGLARGDRVFFLCGNSVESFIAKIGVAKAGGVVTAANPEQTVDVIRHAFDMTRPAYVVADAEFADRLATLPARPHKDIVIPIGGDVPPAAVGFREFHLGQPASDIDVRIHGDDIWEILFTSGTTAMPKAVMLSHTYGYLCALSWAMSYTRNLPHESFLKVVCFTPTTFHVGDQGYMMPALFVGGTVIIGRRFDAADIVRAVAREKGTVVIGGGSSLLSQLVTEFETAGPNSVESLTCIVYGPGPINTDTRDRLKAISPGSYLLSVAAQTECAGGHRFIGEAYPDVYNKALSEAENVVGKPFPLLGARIDRGDTEMSLGNVHIGELMYRSPVMMAGYYRDPAATEAAFEGGWFRSGDLAYESDGGFRVLAGRMKEMIKTGGENVSCVRVESVIQRHPSVDRLVVVGMPDERWGEAVTAIVVLKSTEDPVSEADLIQFARGRLAGFETPKRVIFTDDLQVDFQGKMSRSKIRERFLPRTS